MKTEWKKFLCLLLCVLSVAVCTLTAFADGNVTYDGNAQKFIFAPGSKHSLTDLFDQFKGVMPGDQLTQKITVKNNASNKVKVKIYMRSLGAHEDSVDFLSQLQMTVAKSGDNEMAYMFDAAADQTAGLTDWVLLGTLYSGGEVQLDVTLDVPLALGNEYQDAIGYLDWEFKVEEFEIEDTDPKPPYTGEDHSALVTILIIGACVLLLVLLLAFRKRRQDRE